MNKRLILLELNELNFDLIKKYIDLGYLPNFKKLFNKFGYSRTTSESQYKNIEPWIQWVTAHTGQDYESHKLFHLNESEKLKYSQIWEELEEKNFSVAGLFPMNAKNNLKNSSNIFIPDPWSEQKITGSKSFKKIHSILSFFVNNNSSKKINIINFISLFLVFIKNFRFINIILYIKYFIFSLKRKWFRVLFLELFIFDIFIRINQKQKFDFISLFLNGGAHIQHHYLHNSKVLNLSQSNPNWYLKKEFDPILDIYELYDSIIISKLFKYVNNYQNYRFLIATGLTQDPVKKPKFYYRLSDPNNFVELFKINNFKVVSLMSRDFTIKFSDDLDKNKFIKIFSNLKIKLLNVFELKDYKNEIFVTLIYPNEINKEDSVIVDNQKIYFFNHCNFVAIKNGEHNGNGFLLDTEKKHNNQPLKKIKTHVLNYFK